MSELTMAVDRSKDPYQLSDKVIPHLETIFEVPVSPDKSEWYGQVMMVGDEVCVQLVRRWTGARRWTGRALPLSWRLCWPLYMDLQPSCRYVPPSCRHIAI